VLIAMQSIGLNALSVFVLGLIMIIMDVIVRLSSDDGSLISPAAGGHIMFVPVWGWGIVVAIWGIEEMYGIPFWTVVMYGCGIGGIILLVLFIIGSRLPDPDEKPLPESTARGLTDARLNELYRAMDKEDYEPDQQEPDYDQNRFADMESGMSENEEPPAPDDQRPGKEGSAGHVRKVRKVKRPGVVEQKTCPNCKEIIIVEPGPRPVIVSCDGCGKKYRIKK